MNERFNELVPWYVNGTLSREDKNWIEQYLHDHPSLHKEAEEIARLRDLALLGTDSFRDDLRDRLMRRAAQSVSVAETGLTWAARDEKAKASPHGPAQQLGRFVQWLQLTPALSIVCTVLAVQLVVQIALLNKAPVATSDPEIKGTGSGGYGIGSLPPSLKVFFKPEATESQIRELLASVKGKIVAGPIKDRDDRASYCIYVQDLMEEARKLAASSAIVIDVKRCD